ncbi:Proteinase inhibitor I13, potato inhibitor I [Corchorus olitorius]|uniref:Proteinase inhibitor I13, potato inhibitor I n=1 Tax=Corchorus olitorius TaxID=93759 RepID=A0A1R3KQG0_9ROSI|nr:Proteinase inhibitor I13, potato inhibitor I [Corchorus olitorius]
MYLSWPDIPQYWKSSWPELVGENGETAKTTIETENPYLDVDVVQQGIPIFLDYRSNRVHVFVDEQGKGFESLGFRHGEGIWLVFWVSLMYFPLLVVMFMAAFLELFGYGLQRLVIKQAITVPYFLLTHCWHYGKLLSLRIFKVHRRSQEEVLGHSTSLFW